MSTVVAWIEAYIIVGLLIHFIASSVDEKWEALWVVLWPLSILIEAFEAVTRSG